VLGFGVVGVTLSVREGLGVDVRVRGGCVGVRGGWLGRRPCGRAQVGLVPVGLGFNRVGPGATKYCGVGFGRMVFDRVSPGAAKYCGVGFGATKYCGVGFGVAKP